ncbi:hypothetical protein HUJ05_011950 [Dendroctonus ponderosae]|nr:hypothetical protein HUJ05_011950 [Dendroctonus ponderosae]
MWHALVFVGYHSSPIPRYVLRLKAHELYVLRRVGSSLLLKQPMLSSEATRPQVIICEISRCVGHSPVPIAPNTPHSCVSPDNVSPLFILFISPTEPSDTSYVTALVGLTTYSNGSCEPKGHMHPFQYKLQYLKSTTEY